MDPRLRGSDLVAQPILCGKRFIRTFAATQPLAALITPDGRLCPELQRENLSDLQDALGARMERRDPGGELALLAAEKPVAGRFGTVSPLVDLAHGKPAMQSSLYPARQAETSAAADASRAVCGILFDDLAFHTADETDPWWQVDLLEDSLVEQIEILNRVVVAYKFRHFRIEVSRDGETWTTLYSRSDNTDVSSDPANPFLYELPKPALARFVRLTQLGTNHMHLRRIRVFGRPIAKLQTEFVSAPPCEVQLAALLMAPENKEIFAKAVVSTVQDGIFGRNADSYDVDRLANLAAGIDSSLYATARMKDAKRFGNKGPLLHFAADNAPANGLILEFGVFSGETINHLAARLPDRPVYGFDSFEGLPENWRPGFPKGAFHRANLPVVRGNVKLVVGWFDQTLPGFLAANPAIPVALLHVDCDLYSSTVTVLHQLGDRIGEGTIIVFDEYFNYPGWRDHEFKAFKEFVELTGIRYEYIGLVSRHQQVAVRVVSRQGGPRAALARR
jgi:hypothetical protein